MDRKLCEICGKNPVRKKGISGSGKQKLDYKCGTCHKHGLRSLRPPQTRAEYKAFLQLPKYEAKLQGIIQQIADLQLVVTEYREIKHKYARYLQKQKEKPTRIKSVGKRRYQRYKGTSCDECGFVAKHPCQLDVDHVDGNGLNHTPSNLQTLCANCHRLKTHVAGDHLTPRAYPMAVHSKAVN